MGPKKIIIADDELPARGTFRFLLNKIDPSLELYECKNGEEVINVLEKEKDVSILFLDIEMPGENGLDIARKIKTKRPTLPIAFATGYSEFAVEAFELEAFDYLLKPYRKDRIQKTLDRLWKKREEKVIIKTREGNCVLAPKEIIFLRKDKAEITKVFTTRGIFESKTPLQDMEELLSAYNFRRAHRYVVVNMNMIREVKPWINNTSRLIMKNYEREEVPVSRHYNKEIKEWFEK